MRCALLCGNRRANAPSIFLGGYRATPNSKGQVTRHSGMCASCARAGPDRSSWLEGEPDRMQGVACSFHL